jgi:hypothetical protein
VKLLAGCTFVSRSEDRRTVMALFPSLVGNQYDFG